MYNEKQGNAIIFGKIFDFFTHFFRSPLANIFSQKVCIFCTYRLLLIVFIGYDLNQKFQHFEPYRVFAGFFAKIGHFGLGPEIGQN